jgi:hypothetical protein
MYWLLEESGLNIILGQRKQRMNIDSRTEGSCRLNTRRVEICLNSLMDQQSSNHIKTPLQSN